LISLILRSKIVAKVRRESPTVIDEAHHVTQRGKPDGALSAPNRADLEWFNQDRPGIAS